MQSIYGVPCRNVGTGARSGSFSGLAGKAPRSAMRPATWGAL